MEPIGFFAEVAERPTRAIREQRSRCAWAVCARSEEEKAVRRWFVSKRERYMKPSEMLEYKSGNIHPRYPTPKRRRNMRWIPLAVFGRMNEGIRKGALLFEQNMQDIWSVRFTCFAGMPFCYIYRQQEGLTERTPAWATSRRPTDEVRSSSHSRSASTTRSFRLANTKSGYAADRFARKCAAQGLWCSLHGLAVSDGSCEWVEISAC